MMTMQISKYFIVLLLLSCNKLLAQFEYKEDLIIPNCDETYPEFPGGISAMHQYLHNAIKYPKWAYKNDITDTVRITFTVGTSGKIVAIKAEGYKHERLAQRVVNAFQKMPAWKPGSIAGKPVEMKEAIRIYFLVR